MSAKVIGLGAWCDYVTEDEYRKRLTEPDLAADQFEQPLTEWDDSIPHPAVYRPTVEEAEEAIKEFRRGVHFRVEEFATLSDGRRLLLANDRGWGGTVSGGRGSEVMWAHLTVEEIESTTRNVVLPDDAEETGEEHPWDWLAERIRELGIDTTADELRRLPYDVVLSERLRTQLTRSG